MLSVLDLLSIGIVPVIVATYAYIAYSAVAIRRTIVTRLYRRQALGIGLVAFAFVAIYFANFLGNNDNLALLGGIIFDGMALVLLYWVDSSILAARLSDPLVRDSLNWSRLRWVLWTVSIADIIFTFGVLTYYTLLVGTLNAPDYVNLLVPIIFPLPIYIAAVSGVIVMPIAARRSKDLTLRKNLEWFFIFITIQLVVQGGVGQFFTSDLTTVKLLDGAALLLGLYPLYQSAKRLIPLYKFSPDETKPIISAKKDSF